MSTLALSQDILLPERQSSSISLPFLAITLAALQVLDGAFTSIGIGMYGISMEANPILRVLMETYGVNAALTLVKLGAILTIFILYRLARDIKWIKHAFAGLISLYLVMAIIPWVIILTHSV